MNRSDIIKISIHALGGQGGSVLADWIVRLAEACGHQGQSTSVPGVAQRTGATVYYVEIFPAKFASADRQPVLALMPMPGDVDIVLASEIMEVGRAINRGFVSGLTTVIGSTHRVFAISEKASRADGRLPPEEVINVADARSSAFIRGDMQAAADRTGSVISAVLFGALAGSGRLPFDRKKFETVIEKTGRAVESNLAGFAAGFDLSAQSGQAAPEAPVPGKAEMLPSKTVRAVWKLQTELKDTLPGAVHAHAELGLARALDYQGPRQAMLYLSRLQHVAACDDLTGGARRNWRLTDTVAKHLAVWMSSEDIFRIADLKIRQSRFNRFRADLKAEQNQIMQITEYLHPRHEEFYDILPEGLSRLMRKSRLAHVLLKPFFGKGRHIRTTGLAGFLLMYVLAHLRFLRPHSFKYKLENRRMEAWLDMVTRTASADYEKAVELARLPHLLKGYGETYERGVDQFETILSLHDALKETLDSGDIAALHEAATADDSGKKLADMTERLRARVAAE